MQFATRLRPAPLTASLATLLPWAIAGVLLVPFGLLLHIGMLARYSGDDYCWAADVRDLGYLGFQTRMYETMFGRWASTGLGSALTYLGPSAAGVVQPVMLVAWLASFTWCIRTWSRGWGTALVLALVIILAIVSLTASRVDGLQAVYWQTATVTYIAPLIVAAVGVAATVRLRSPVVAAAAGFVAAGFNESFMAVEVACLLLALLFLRGWRLLSLVALIGAALSAAIVVAAPGNDSRIENLHQPSTGGLIELIPMSVENFAERLVSSPVALLALLAALLLGARMQLRASLPLALAGTAVLGLCAIVPSLYAMQVVLPRTALVPISVLVIGLAVVSINAGRFLRPHPAGAALLALVSVALAFFVFRQLAPVEADFQVFTRAWSEQTAQLKSATGTEDMVVVAPVDSPVNVWQVDTRPESYVNQCMSKFYEVGPVRTP